jgi:hypothetical protein
MAEKRPAPKPPTPRPTTGDRQGIRKGGGWQKPVKPPTQQGRPGGLPPKKGS